MGPISGGLLNTPQPFGYFVMRSKGVNQSATATTQLEAMPVFASVDGNISPYPLRYDRPSMDFDFEMASGGMNTKTELQVSGSEPPFTSFWGDYNVGKSPTDYNGFVLADIPRQPLLSLGQFMHAQLRNSMATGDGQEVDQCSPLMPVGGSLCNPFVPLDKSHFNVPGQSAGATFVMDDNYMMNDALFDSYFFSSVPPASPDAAYKAVFPALTSGPAAFNDTNIKANTVTLPTARMKFYSKNGAAPTAAALQKSGCSSACTMAP